MSLKIEKNGRNPHVSKGKKINYCKDSSQTADAGISALASKIEILLFSFADVFSKLHSPPIYFFDRPI